MAKYRTFDEIIRAAVLFGYHAGSGDKHIPSDGETAVNDFRATLADGDEGERQTLVYIDERHDWPQQRYVTGIPQGGTRPLTDDEVGQRTRDFYTGWATPFAPGW